MKSFNQFREEITPLNEENKKEKSGLGAEPLRKDQFKADQLVSWLKGYDRSKFSNASVKKAKESSGFTASTIKRYIELAVDPKPEMTIAGYNGTVLPNIKQFGTGNSKPSKVHLDKGQLVAFDGVRYYYGYDKRKDRWFRIDGNSSIDNVKLRFDKVK